MKLAIAFLGAALLTVSAAAAAPSDYNGGPYPAPGRSSFQDAYSQRAHKHRAPAPPAPQPTYQPAPSRPQFAPFAPIGGPPPQRFKPYGYYSKGGSPSAPKPPGYIDLYGTKRSEHPFLY
jgi:hypothetical protein